MLFEFFGVHENPFGVTPETRFLYPSHEHEEARASLSHSFHSARGFVVLVGQPGMGKTTLLMDFLHTLKASARIAFLFQTQCNSRGFLEQLMLDFDLGARNESEAQTHDRLRTFLAKEHSTGKRVVIVVDEAQNLDPEVLETVRLLSDFETERAKLLHIVLSGQPQLAEKLMSPGLLQLQQRIGMICRLSALTATETREYIEHRLMVAGRTTKNPLFSDDAYKMIALLSKGIPRNINSICFHSLSIAYPLYQRLIDVDIVEEATRDLDLSKDSSLCSTPCVVSAPAAVSEEASTIAPTKAPMPQPKTVISVLPAASVEVSSAKPERAEEDRYRESFRWPQSFPAPAELDGLPSTTEAQRTLKAIACMRPNVPARSNGAMPAVPVSAYWEMMDQRGALDDRSSTRHEAVRTVQETQRNVGLGSNRQEIHPAAIADFARPAAGEPNRSAQFSPRYTAIFVISLVLLMGTLLVLWPEPRPIAIAAWDNSAQGGKPQPAVAKANRKVRSGANASKWTSRADVAKQPLNHGTEDPPSSIRDQPYNVRVETNQSAVMSKADVALDGAAPLLAMTEPEYPASARTAGIEGTVVLDTTLDSSGEVVAIEPVSGDVQLVSAAMDAVRQWRFDPQAFALQQGLIHQTVRINFTLR